MRRHRHLLMLAAATLLGLGACALVGAGAGGPPPPPVPGRTGIFPHDVHLGPEAGLTCLDCHSGAAGGPAATMPTAAVCALCHFPEPGPDGEEPPEDAIHPIVAAFILPGEARPTWSRVTAPPVALAFRHDVHLAAGVECTSCHAGIEESRTVTPELAVSMAACTSCHAERQVADAGCLGCHPGVDETWKPPSHTPSWERLHGATARAAGLRPPPAADCTLCHRDGGPTASCEACHLAELPADHTPFFKNQGHGQLALFDRARCAACHQEDSCRACHENTRPRSHLAGFGAPTDRHCLTCHFQGSGASPACTVCHGDGAPSHELAPPPPPDVPAHATATSCLSCHRTVRPPRHPYTGDGAYCRICHR